MQSVDRYTNWHYHVPVRFGHTTGLVQLLLRMFTSSDDAIILHSGHKINLVCSASVSRRVHHVSQHWSRSQPDGHSSRLITSSLREKVQISVVTNQIVVLGIPISWLSVSCNPECVQRWRDFETAAFTSFLYLQNAGFQQSSTYSGMNDAK